MNETRNSKPETRISFWHPAALICTVFGVGKLRPAPGTWGSLAGVGIGFYTLSPLLIIGLFVLGVYCSNIYSKKTNKEDASEIVIDEVVGQLIAGCILSYVFLIFSELRHEIFLTLIQIFGDASKFVLILIPFLVFRFFDIVKPFPVGWIDRNVKGGLGVMLDDVVAGIMAGITSALIFYLL